MTTQSCHLHRLLSIFDPLLCDPILSFSTYTWQPSLSVITVTIPAVKAPVRTPTMLTVGTRPISPSSRQLSPFGSSANRNLAASPSAVAGKSACYACHLLETSNYRSAIRCHSAVRSCHVLPFWEERQQYRAIACPVPGLAVSCMARSDAPDGDSPVPGGV